MKIKYIFYPKDSNIVLNISYIGFSESYHPGFLSSTNYLLPWDVTVGSKSKKAWPAISKYSNRGRRGRPSGSILPQTVKVFIGVEYECSSGHR